MAKLKPGDYVIKKTDSDTIRRVEKVDYFFHEAFTHRYLKIEGIDTPQNEDDYILVNSFEESLTYAMKGILYALIGSIVMLATGLLIYRFVQFINL